VAIFYRSDEGVQFVPSVEGLFSLQQIPEPRIGAPPIEHPPDLIEFVRKKLSGELEHQRLAEIEFLPVRDREIFFLVIGIVRPRLDVLVDVSKPEKLAGFPAETASCSCGSPRLANSNACCSSFQSTDTGIGVLLLARNDG
jgi:hypothetical protein